MRGVRMTGAMSMVGRRHTINILQAISMTNGRYNNIRVQLQTRGEHITDGYLSEMLSLLVKTGLVNKETRGVYRLTDEARRVLDMSKTIR